MSDTSVDPAKLQQEVAYYKQRLDELAGENLKYDYQISGLKKEVRQRRQAFTLLSELQRTVHAEKEIPKIFRTAIEAANATLGMDKTVVLTPTGKADTFQPAYFAGFGQTDPAQLAAVAERAILFPPEFALGTGVLVVNKKTATTPLIEELRQTLAVPYFVCVPVLVEGAPIGLLLSARLKEAGSLFPPIDQGDVETFAAIAALISAVVQNMRVAVLQEMDRLKTNFFANISHEFRTPITLTLGPLDALMASRYGEVAELQRNQLEIMQRNQLRLLGLVNQILDLAKLEAGGMELKASQMPDVHRFISQRLEQFRSMADKRSIELRMTPDPRLASVELYLDAEKFDKVVFNLLSNAHKFTKHGTIEVTTDMSHGDFRMAVRDTGIGIKADQLPSIFDRFKQADGSASREFAGTGIGLALVQEIVSLHAGKITVTSEYGVGTTFTVAFPLGKAHLTPRQIIAHEEEFQVATPRVVEIREGGSDEDSVEPVNEEALATFDKEKSTVLYVDDNRDLRNYVRDLLVRSYNVFVAVNGLAGLEAARRYKPDLILSDVMMPKMTGTEFCQKVREDPELRVLPFVLLTAKSSLESKIEGLDEGADDYLSKPFAESELLARLRNLIKLRHKQLQLKRELDAAREIQRALLPPPKQRLGRLEIEGLYHPCEELSGDFYDVIPHRDYIYFYVADVTSHGTAAAQVTYLLKGIFNDAIAHAGDASLEQVLAIVDQKYTAFGLEYDVCVQAARIEPERGILHYARAGAPAPLRVRAAGFDMLAARPGPPFSSRKSAGPRVFESTQVQLAAGDRLFFYTDGCYEFAAGKRQFGQKRLGTTLASASASGWPEQVLETLAGANGSLTFDDDLTIVRIALLDAS